MTTKQNQKPPGWKNHRSGFWIKDSKYGQRYMCPECRKNNLGIGAASRIHLHTCSRWIAPK